MIPYIYIFYKSQVTHSQRTGCVPGSLNTSGLVVNNYNTSGQQSRKKSLGADILTGTDILLQLLSLGFSLEIAHFGFPPYFQLLLNVLPDAVMVVSPPRSVP